jgi:hypothetical protein
MCYLEVVTRRGPSFKHASGNAIYEVDPARRARWMLLAKEPKPSLAERGHF